MEIPLARGRVDRFAVLMLLAHTVGVLAVASVAFWLIEDVAGGTALVFVLIALTFAWLAWCSLYTTAWLKTRKIDVPMELQPTGLVARSMFGELVIPWATITSATIERTWSGRRLRLRLVPESDPRHGDIIVAWLKPEMWKIVERQGLRYSLRVLDIGVDDLRQAFVSRSGGLVHVA